MSRLSTSLQNTAKHEVLSLGMSRSSSGKSLGTGQSTRQEPICRRKLDRFRYHPDGHYAGSISLPRPISHCPHPVISRSGCTANWSHPRNTTSAQAPRVLENCHSAPTDQSAATRKELYR